MTFSKLTHREQRKITYIGRLTTKNLMLAIESATESHGRLNVKTNQARSLENIQDLQSELMADKVRNMCSGKKCSFTILWYAVQYESLPI